MSEFVLFDNDNSILLGLYSSFDEAKKEYENFILKYKVTPVCEIIEFKGRAPVDFSFGIVEAKWTIRPGGAWMKT